MSFVKGGLKLKGKGDVTKQAKPATLLEKRPQTDPAENELEPKVDKKVKPSVAQPPEKPKEESKVDVLYDDKKLVQEAEKQSFKTDYQKRIFLQKQQKLKEKIDQKLLTSHR